MSKKLESFNLQEAKDLLAMAKEGRCVLTVPALIATGESLVERVEELDKQLLTARELADKLLAPSVVCHQGGVEYEIAYPPHEAVRVIKRQASDFLKMLEE